MRGTMRSLFGKSPKGKPDTVLEDGASSAQAVVEAVVGDTSTTVQEKNADVVPLKPKKSMVDDPSTTVEEKDVDDVPPKIKRPPPGGKGSPSAGQQQRLVPWSHGG